MSPDGSNDEVFVYRDEAGEWRWTRFDTANGNRISASTEGYESKSYAQAAAAEYNPGVRVKTQGDDDR